MSGIFRSNNSSIRSMLYYRGTITCGANFVGDKDVTITAVDPTKAYIIGMRGIPNVPTNNIIGLSIAVAGGNNLWFDDVDVFSATIVRFHGVHNNDAANPHDLLYSFIVKEYK